VNPNANTINAASQVDDPDSVFSFYRKVIAFRHSDPVVAYGDFTMLLPDDEHVYAFKRSLPEAELLVLANFSGTGRTADFDDGTWFNEGAELVLGNYPPDAGELQPLDLRPWEVKVFRRSV
jgi:oligo-1,6-glucosidase